jgi:biotin carboxyl carrier protein
MKRKTLKLDINGKAFSVTINEFNAYEAKVTVNGKKFTVGLNDLGIEQVADLQIQRAAEYVPAPAPVASPGTAPVLHKPKSVSDLAAIIAPLPGLILKISVSIGDTVTAGQTVLVMEAMKMENEVQAISNGTVKSIRVKEGDSVNEGDVLIELAQ